MRVCFTLTLMAMVVWAYWPIFNALHAKWASDPQYSHGYLVPVLAFGILAIRRDRMKSHGNGLSSAGIRYLAIGALMQMLGGYLYFDWLSAISLIATCLGLFGTYGGRPGLAWGWPSCLYLGYMVPLPYFIETGLSRPLRGIATQWSTWVLQTIGSPAISEGNIILVERGRVAVAEACSGLSMFLAFFAIATALLIVVRKPFLETFIMIASVPVIAVISNVIRIVVTGIAIDLRGGEFTQTWVHDQIGWLMMPIAVSLLFLELWVIGKLLIPVPSEVSFATALSQPIPIKAP